MSALNDLALRVSSSLETLTNPVPMPAYTGDPNLITPGVIGFIAMFVVAAVTVLLVVDMNRRIRRTKYRVEVRERLEDELEAQKLPPV